jgi:hypothetical protein
MAPLALVDPGRVRERFSDFGALLDSGLADAPVAQSDAGRSDKWPAAYGFWIIVVTCGAFWGLAAFYAFRVF